MLGSIYLKLLMALTTLGGIVRQLNRIEAKIDQQSKQLAEIIDGLSSTQAETLDLKAGPVEEQP